MKQNQPVSQLMTRDPLTVHVKQKLSEVRQIVSGHGIHHIPVVSGTKLVGLISASDLLRVSYGGGAGAALDSVLDTTSIEEAMTRDLHTVQINEPIKRAAEILSSAPFHCLPVVEGEDLAGVITSTDLIRFLHSLY